MIRSRPIALIRGPSLGVLVLVALVGALGAGQAGGDPTGRSAPANRLVASAANTTPTEDAGRLIVGKISGQILSSKRFAARLCRVRDLRAEGTSLSGAPFQVDFHTSNKAGRFSADFPLDYGGTDPEDGEFRNGHVPYGGGTVTFTLVVPKRKVQRKGGDFFRTYTCRPLSATVQISVPPQH